MNKKILYVIAAFLGITVAVIGYKYFPKWIYDLSLAGAYANYIYASVGLIVFLSIITFIPTKQQLQIKQTHNFWNDRDRKAKEYRENILEKYQFKTSGIPQIFSGLHRINLIVWDKYAGHESFGRIYSDLYRAGNFDPYYGIQNKPIEFLNKVEEIIGNRLPTFMFIDIGSESVELEHIDEHLRILKHKHPEINIVVGCSYFYAEEKCDAIKALIDERIVYPVKISDDFFGHNSKDIVNRIQDCLS